MRNYNRYAQLPADEEAEVLQVPAGFILFPFAQRKKFELNDVDHQWARKRGLLPLISMTPNKSEDLPAQPVLGVVDAISTGWPRIGFVRLEQDGSFIRHSGGAYANKYGHFDNKIFTRIGDFDPAAGTTTEYVSTWHTGRTDS